MKIERITFYSVLFLFILAISLITNNVDMDYWARVIQGDAFLQTGNVLYNDPFSYIPTHKWIDHEWGSGLVFAFLQNSFGYISLILLKALVIFGILFLIIQTINLQENKSTKLHNIIFFIIAFYGLQNLWINGIRCHFFTFLFFALYLYILELVRKRQKDKLLFILPPVMLIWCNVHGGCVSGLGLLLMYALGEALNKKPFSKYIYTAIASAAVIFINPYGFDYIKFLLSATTMKRVGINEWNALFSTSFYTLLSVKIFVCGTIIITISSLIKNIKNIDWTKYIVLSTVTLLGLSHIKQAPFAVICGAVFLYYDFYLMINLIFSFLKNIPDRVIKTKEIVIYLLLFAVSALSITSSNTMPKNMSYYPYKVVEFIQDNKLKGKLLNEFGIGSYLAYKLYPNMLIYMDGRYEEVYYDDSVIKNDDFYIPTANWKSTLEESGGADYVIVRKDFMAYENMLNNAPNYKEIFNDEKFALFCKNTLIKRDYVIKQQSDINFYNKLFFDKGYKIYNN